METNDTLLQMEKAQQIGQLQNRLEYLKKKLNQLYDYNHTIVSNEAIMDGPKSLANFNCGFLTQLISEL